MKIVFMGTPDFAVPCLQKLLDLGHDVCGVFTQPDKPKGRHSVLTPPPVKELAVSAGIPVFQPKSMRNGEALEILAQLKPELIVVVAYGKILPKEILEFPKHGCINIHASLLPKLRGSAPIQWSVINGLKSTGVTAMQMDEGIDTGDMLVSACLDILPDETSGELSSRLSVLGAQTLEKVLEELQKGELKPVKQNDAESTHAPMLSREMCPIDWNESALDVHNKIRGMMPWPGTTCVMCGKEIKIHKSALSEVKGGKPGEIVATGKALTVSCAGGDCVDLLVIQAQGKKPMAAVDYLRGNPVKAGSFMDKE